MVTTGGAFVGGGWRNGWRRRLVCRLATGLAVVLAVGAVATVPAGADDDPAFIPWPSLLPGFATGHQPSSANDCTSGSIRCVDAVIHEMDRRFQPLAQACNHNALFSLMYLRTTEEYRRAATEPGFFTDPAFVNHQDAVFARYYFDAWDRYRAGDVAGTSRSWRIAFAAADGRRVAGIGNMLLGMSAHVNRDLPYVLAEIGLVRPDGSSRKDDHDQVNQFLNRVIQPLMAEAAARFDPRVTDLAIDGTTLDETLVMQLLMGWRELAWRNAEALVAAQTPAQRALVEAQIEAVAAVEANLIVVATAYSALNVQQALGELAALAADPTRILRAQLDRTLNVLTGVFGTLFTSGAALRDNHCAANR